MRILLEALGIHYLGGGRSATLNLFEALFDIDRETQYTVLLTQPEPLLNVLAGNVHQVVAPTRNRFAVRLWAQAVIPSLARGCDLVHFCKNLTVLAVPTKTVVTIYDLTTLIYPALFPRTDVLYWRWIQPHLLRRVDRVIAISETTAHDLERFYGIQRAKIAPIYPTYGSRFAPASTVEIQRVWQKYGLPDQVIAHVGRIDPKNNLPTLIRAFARFTEVSGFDGKLVLVGGEYAKSRDRVYLNVIRELGMGDRIVTTGPVPAEELPALYSGALMVAFPSLHEGFGIVAAEAMACGAPLVVSGAGALKEVVGDAALVVESPYDVIGLADAMQQLWADPACRVELRRKGLARVDCFRPRTIAEQTLQCYRDVVGMV